jgi:hypothetical protein
LICWLKCAECDCRCRSEGGVLKLSVVARRNRAGHCGVGTRLRPAKVGAVSTIGARDTSVLFGICADDDAIDIERLTERRLSPTSTGQAETPSRQLLSSPSLRSLEASELHLLVSLPRRQQLTPATGPPVWTEVGTPAESKGVSAIRFGNSQRELSGLIACCLTGVAIRRRSSGCLL